MPRKKFPSCIICGRMTTTSTAKVCKKCGVKIRILKNKAKYKSIRMDKLIEIYLKKGE